FALFPTFPRSSCVRDGSLCAGVGGVVLRSSFESWRQLTVWPWRSPPSTPLEHSLLNSHPIYLGPPLSPHQDLVAVLETARCVAVALSPITPTLSQNIYMQLGFTAEQFSAIQWADTHWGGLKAGQQTAEPAPVFARIEQEEGAEAGAQAGGKGAKGGKGKGKGNAAGGKKQQGKKGKEKSAELTEPVGSSAS
ncbi:unnamed protein product, partial [Closterium sp. NIES-54]